jgi:PAS domain S-box-containing protein
MSPVHDGHKNIEYYLNLIDVVRDGIICTDIEGRIVFMNQTALTMWGYQEKEILGKPFELIFVEEDRPQCCPRVIQATLADRHYEGEFLFQRRDGSRFPGYLSSSRLVKRDKKQDIVFVVHDLTEQKRMQRRLLESQKLASLGKLVEGVSHEIRNPIVTLGGYARRLKRTFERDHSAQEYIGIILEEVERMESMLKDVEEYLQFAQAHRPSFTRVNLQDIMKGVIGGLSLPDNVLLEEVYPSEGPYIYGNPRRLHELFYHLLENSIEAMPGGGCLRMAIEQTDHQARVCIEDSGVGIPKHDIPNMFSPFFTTKTKGAGVGLAKVYIIVDEHSGMIDVQSVIERGTTFTLTFPRDRRQRPRRQV